jgi:hypothetical protein
MIGALQPPAKDPFSEHKTRRFGKLDALLDEARAKLKSVC